MSIQLCSSLVFQFTNESPIYDILEDISFVYDAFFIYFLYYVGPIFVLMNLFAIFILTRRELRTPYTIVFLAMALDQSVAILGQDILLLKTFLKFGCGITESFVYQVFEIAIANLCAMCSAHATWLAVIITFVRLRHISTSIREPSLRYIIVLCSLSFVIVILVGIPELLSNDIYFSTDTNGSKPVLMIAESARIYDNNCLLLRITFISTGVLYNALPCVLLMVPSAALTYRLSKIRKIHKNTMMGRSSAVNAESVRSSWMIAMIVFTTLITGIPQAIVNIIVGFMSERDGSTISANLSALIVTLVVFSSAINLTIYLCMSRRIREVTMSYLCCICLRVKNTKTSSGISSSTPPKT